MNCHIEGEECYYIPTKEWTKFAASMHLQQLEITKVMGHTKLQYLEYVITPKFVGSNPFVLCHITRAHWISI
mgnify:FL=1